MPKLNSFKVKIQTGQAGIDEAVYFNFNNHKMAFENITGSTQSGQVFEGEYEVQSFCHSLTLVGPESGQWDIQKLAIEFDCDGGDPYCVQYGTVTLDATTEVNLWRDAPGIMFDV